VKRRTGRLGPDRLSRPGSAGARGSHTRTRGRRRLARRTAGPHRVSTTPRSITEEDTAALAVLAAIVLDEMELRLSALRALRDEQARRDAETRHAEAEWARAEAERVAREKAEQDKAAIAAFASALHPAHPAGRHLVRLRTGVTAGASRRDCRSGKRATTARFPVRPHAAALPPRCPGEPGRPPRAAASRRSPCRQERLHPSHGRMSRCVCKSSTRENHRHTDRARHRPQRASHRVRFTAKPHRSAPVRLRRLTPARVAELLSSPARAARWHRSP
jgi:hypothetical protein